MTSNRPVIAKHSTTGEHYTTTRHLAAKRGDQVLEDRPATDKYGRWLPPKPRKPITPARDNHGRFTPTNEPTVGEEEA